MAAALPIIGAVGTVVQTIGAIGQGNAGKQSGEYNAQIAEQNIGIVRQQAKDDERQLRVHGQKTLGEMRAGFGASGVQSNEGSAADIIGQSAANIEMDALTVRHGGEIQAWKHQQQANLYRLQGANAQTAGLFEGAGKLLSGGARFAGEI